MKQFSNIFSLSKTLAFSACPVGRTREYIDINRLLCIDEHRADSYLKVKKIIDEYHKIFINEALSNFILKFESTDDKDSLLEFYEFYNISSKDDKRKETLLKIQDNLRKQIATEFRKYEKFEILFKDKLIKEELPKLVSDPEKLSLLKEFDKFATYFTGFHENRKNIYTAGAKSTGIAFRVINENLPKFIDNIKIFNTIKDVLAADDLEKLREDLSENIGADSIADIFSLQYYAHLLTQSQIDKYNLVISGKTIDDGTKIKGLNEYINLYNQSQNKQQRLPKLKTLFKQILSNRSIISFFYEKFNSANDLLLALRESYKELNDSVFTNGLSDILKGLSNYDLNGINLTNDENLTGISKRYFGNWELIKQAIMLEYESHNPQKHKESNEKFEKRKDKYFKSLKSISIETINNAIKALGAPFDEMPLEQYFEKMDAVNTESIQKPNVFKRIECAYTDAESLLKMEDCKDDYYLKNNVAKIKELLDAIKGLQWFIKPLLGTIDDSDKDELFYSDFMPLYEKLDNTISPLYNMTRNYITKKPYNNDKFKLNFNNPTLLNGWDENKESDNLCVILRKDGLYYIAIMNNNFSKSFSNIKEDISAETPCYEKIDYKLLPGANKMLPKVFFSKSRIDEFNPSRELLAKYDNGTHTKGTNFNLQDCHDLIDFFKHSISIHHDWKEFDFKFSPTESYADISEFYREVEQQGYKINFRNISEEFINSLVDEGKIYLFKLYNKDFSTNSKGTPNMHTLYWKMLFDPENLKNVVYKLNGKAEIFYRKESIKKVIVHDANMAINNKSTSKEVKPTCTFGYDLIKDKRFTKEQFSFHVPITLNFKAKQNINLNTMVNQFIKDGGVEHIIGIDRGERNLLYIAVTDLNGNLEEQFNLNAINNATPSGMVNVDYHRLLSKKEGENKSARKDWGTIQNIKEVKDGYLSQVIHKIAKMVIEKKAIIVLEDLNTGFKRGRQKVEKQVYQKFEKMLIDKLNYLVDKKEMSNKPCGLLNAMQLTYPCENMTKVGKQCGFLFYIPAWNTSNIDPTTGFANLFDGLSTHYQNIEKSRAFFNKFDIIRYNKVKSYYEFAFDYKNFTTRATGIKSAWTLCTQGERIIKFRNPNNNGNWDDKCIVLTTEFNNLFKENNISRDGNLKEAILSQSNKEFYEKLINLFRLTLQLRNSNNAGTIDSIVSPVVNAQGEFFNSSNAPAILPKDADANGAYNIARKGQIIVNRIKESKDIKDIDYSITNEEWLTFAQK
ncbi:MAG: type V CRISPR-associated protein Cas12a/Cpf1 [Muribaculaceae bacterium]